MEDRGNENRDALGALHWRGGPPGASRAFLYESRRIRGRGGPTGKIVHFHEDIGDQDDGNVYILVSVEGCTQVGILQVAGHKTGIGRLETRLGNSYTLVRRFWC